MKLPDDPLDEGLVVTDGLTNLEVGGFMPLGFNGADEEALISHSHPTVRNIIVKTIVMRMRSQDMRNNIIYYTHIPTFFS